MNTGKLTILLLILSFIIIVSCKKKSDDSGGGSSGSSRLVKMTGYYHNVLEGYNTFIYQGNLIHEICGFGFLKTADTSYKVQIEYASGRMSVITWLIHDTTWKPTSRVFILDWAGDIPSETATTEYDASGAVMYEYRSVFTYAGGQVSEEKLYVMQGMQWVLDSRNVYTYNTQGQLQKEEILNAGGLLRSTTSYTWQNGVVTEEKKVPADSLLLHRNAFEYSGSKLSKTSFYFYQNHTWLPSGTAEYQYDAAGNLVTEFDNGYPPADDYKTVFEYASGQGNINVFYLATGDGIWNGQPQPIPSKPSQAFFGLRLTSHLSRVTTPK